MFIAAFTSEPGIDASVGAYDVDLETASLLAAVRDPVTLG